MDNQLKTISFNPASKPYVFTHSLNDKAASIQKLDKSLEEEGKDENTKNQAEKKEVDRQTVEDLVKKSNRYIISISSTFPWTIFPNTINVEEGRVTLIFRQFMSSQSRSVDIRDISNVFIESSLLFASIQIVSRTFTQNDIKIGYLNKKEAYKIRRIIEGLRIFASNNIDTSNYEIRELITKTEEFHTNNSNENPLM